MTRRRLFCLLTIALLAVCPPTRASAADRKPNIVVILADDLGINDLSCYGRADQPTPNLDRLASQGIRFTQAYCAQPICSPSRAALLTGKTPARLHLTTYLPGRPDAPSQMLLHPKFNQALPADVPTVAEMLKPAGYTTALFGKWHLGEGQYDNPIARGFDAFRAGHASTVPNESEGGKGEYDLTAAAERFIEENREKPFFLILSHNSPHIPLGAKPELIEKHKDAFNPVYAAMMETLDDSVGRVLAKLDAMKLIDETLVIFTSDNGGLHVLEGGQLPTHNTPFRAGKGFVYEGGLRIPLIVRWPGKAKAGTTCDAPVIHTDWVPTWVELAGVERHGEFDGLSLMPLLAGNGTLAPRPLFWHFPHYTNQGSRPAGAMREGDWKLVEHYEDGRAELFDLLKDPGETTDLSMKQPDRVAAMRGKLAQWRKDVGAQENAPNPDFRLDLWRRLYEAVDVSTLKAKSTAAETAAALVDWRKLMDLVTDPPPKPGEKRETISSGSEGLIILPASAATPHGQNLRYEPDPHKNTLGYWTIPTDWASWEFDVTHAGTYEVRILQGAGKGCGDAAVDVVVGDQKITFKTLETGHFQNFVPRAIGTVKLEPGRHTLEVRPREKQGVAVMDLRRVTLVRIP